MLPIPYGKQEITHKDIQAVSEVLKSDFLTQGPQIKQFEKDFAKYVGAKYAVAVSNGTAALHLSNLAIGIKKGSKVITCPITFVASANAVIYCGGEIDFVDIDEKTYTIDLAQVEEKLQNSPKGTYSAIIPVDLAGYPVNVEKLRQIADKYNLYIIEDSCHAPGAYFIDSNKKKQLVGNGNFSDLQIFSFHPVKHIATGEGGMITTNNKVLYDKLISLRTHGITKSNERLSQNDGGWYYEMQELGFNYRLSDINAALGISQLKRANENIIKRNTIAQKYNEAFKSINGIRTPFVDTNVYHAYHLYIIQVQKRKALYDYLKKHNIFTQVHYIPVHLQPYYKKFGWQKNDFPKAEAYYEQCLSLPMFPTLTDNEQEYVIEKVKEFLKTD